MLPSQKILQQAVSIQGRLGFRFYDSLIIATALAGGAKKLLSEDFQHGRKNGPLEIVNPFR